MQTVLRNLRRGTVAAFFSGVVLQAMINSIYTFRPEAFIATVVLGGSITLAMAIGLSLASWRRSAVYRQQQAFIIPRQGLIFTVGLQPATIRLALTQQKPAFVGFVCSVQSEDFAKDLQTEFGFDDDHARRKIADPLNVEEVRQDTAALLDWMSAQGLPATAVAVDVTGGLTSMSVAAYSVARDRRFDTQYIHSRFDKQTNQIIALSQDAKILSRYPYRCLPWSTDLCFSLLS